MNSKYPSKIGLVGLKAFAMHMLFVESNLLTTNIRLPNVIIKKDCKTILFQTTFKKMKIVHNYYLTKSNNQGKYLYIVTSILYFCFIRMTCCNYYARSFSCYMMEVRLYSRIAYYCQNKGCGYFVKI